MVICSSWADTSGRSQRLYVNIVRFLRPLLFLLRVRSYFFPNAESIINIRQVMNDIEEICIKICSHFSRKSCDLGKTYHRRPIFDFWWIFSPAIVCAGREQLETLTSVPVRTFHQKYKSRIATYSMRNKNWNIFCFLYFDKFDKFDDYSGQFTKSCFYSFVENFKLLLIFILRVLSSIPLNFGWLRTLTITLDEIKCCDFESEFYIYRFLYLLLIIMFNCVRS